MTEEIKEAISKLYANTNRTVFSLSSTGGGAACMPMLLTIPGASNCLMDCQVPYARSALNQIFKRKTDGAVTAVTGAELAIYMRRRAYELLLEDTKDFNSLHNTNVLGISCTAALVSFTPKKGAHRCHVACASSGGIVTYSLQLSKGARDREGEDNICSTLMIDALLENSNNNNDDNDVSDATSKKKNTEQHEQQKYCFTEKLLLEDEVVIRNIQELENISNSTNPEDALQSVITGKSKSALFWFANGEEKENNLEWCEGVTLPAGSYVYPGSFNPLHKGHIQLVRAALDCNKDNNGSSSIDEQQIHPPLVFEIAAVNADKADIDLTEILLRTRKILSNPLLKDYGLSNVAVCITSFPLFVQKTELFPACNFIMGSDTMIRLLNPQYYGDKNALQKTKLSENQIISSQKYSLIAALASMQCYGIKFIVGGRREKDGKFLSCNTILDQESFQVIPPSLKELFVEIKESDFRVDLSSSEIRKKENTESTT
jgi:hypothetical protein